MTIIMRKYLKYCKFFLIALFVFSLGLSLCYPGEASASNAQVNEISVDKTPAAGENTGGLSRNTVFNFPISVTGDGKSLGDITITETTPGSLMVGQDVKFTFINSRLKDIVWDIYSGEKPAGIAGAWIYAPPTVGSDINTIKGLKIIDQTHYSVTIRIDSVQAGDRGYLAICVNGDGNDKDAGKIRPGNAKLIIAPPPGTSFTESEAVKTQVNNLNFNPTQTTQSKDALPRASLSYSGAASVSMAVYGSTAWPKLSHDNSNTSISPYASSPSAVKWAIKLDDFGGQDNETFRQAPVIGRNNVVFITADSWTTKELRVYAIYPDGTLKWVSVLSTDGDFMEYSNLTLSDDGRLYIGTNRYGKLYCIDEETGTVNWVYTAPIGPPGDNYPNNDIYSPPIIHPVTGDIIFSNWALICLDRNGNERWVYYDGADVYEHFAAISPYNGLIYFCDWGLAGAGNNCRIQAVDIIW